MAQPELAIIDYQMGNIRSVSKALEIAGARVRTIERPAEFSLKFAAIVLPGVGAFRTARKNLQESGLWEKLLEYLLVYQRPFLGICLGLQLLMAESSEEKKTAGLNIFSGSVVAFPKNKKYPVPHIGWNSIYPLNSPDRFWQNIPAGSYFYFDHSYYVRPQDKKLVAAYSDYGRRFTAALYSANIFACQFHPEKSSLVGQQLLKNFIRWLKCW